MDPLILPQLKGLCSPFFPLCHWCNGLCMILQWHPCDNFINGSHLKAYRVCAWKQGTIARRFVQFGCLGGLISGICGLERSSSSNLKRLLPAILSSNSVGHHVIPKNARHLGSKKADMAEKRLPLHTASKFFDISAIQLRLYKCDFKTQRQLV